MATHLFVRSLSHTHHEEEQSCEADSLHCCDEGKGVGQHIGRPHCHFHQLCWGQGAEAGHVQTLSQAEGEGEQSQGGGHEPTEHQVTHALLH